MTNEQLRRGETLSHEIYKAERASSELKKMLSRSKIVESITVQDLECQLEFVKSWSQDICREFIEKFSARLDEKIAKWKKEFEEL